MKSETFLRNHITLDGSLWVALVITVLAMGLGIFALWKSMPSQLANLSSSIDETTVTTGSQGIVLESEQQTPISTGRQDSTTEVRQTTVSKNGESKTKTTVTVDGEPVASTTRRHATKGGSTNVSSSTVNMDVSISASSSNSSTVDTSSTVEVHSNTSTEVYKE